MANKKSAPVAPFVGEVPTFEIADGVVFMGFGDGGLYMPLPIFKKGMLRAEEAIARYASQRGEVVAMPRRRVPKPKH